MKEIWEFCENLNEVVYVSDIDTYEIIYVNRKMREMYKVNSVEDFKGKKCYEIFQGGRVPCAMCNNKRLRSGFFDEWTYFNPVLKRPFSVKDTLIEYNGKYYRMEIAIDMSMRTLQKENERYYARNESMINEALKVALSTSNAVKSINVFLEYLGKSMGCERIYIFELFGEHLDNTFEWCALGVEPQIDNLQQMPKEIAKFWLERFGNNQNVIIRNVEDIKEVDPMMYDTLKPQSIYSLVASPLFYNGEVIGFYGVDNPPVDSLRNISTLLQIVGHFIVALLRRKKLMDKLENLSYYDQLTGFGNRHAMDEYIKNISNDNSIGIIYCDVMGLKRVNDIKGHIEGDKLLIRACTCIKDVFHDYSRFRIGGDEFLVLCKGITESELTERVYALKKSMRDNHAIMAIGSVWRESGEDNFEKLLAEADMLMYKDKRSYYLNMALD